MKISIFSNVNLDLLSQYLKEYKVYQSAGYNQWIQEALEPSVDFLEFKSDAIFLILDGNALLESFDLENGKEVLLENLNYCSQFISKFPTVPIFISNIDIVPKRFMPSDQIRIEHELMNYWETELQKLMDNNANVHLFDLRSLIENNGRLNFYSDKMWYMGSIPYSIKAFTIISKHIIDQLTLSKTVRKKVLILDLDNTLWGGVLGEDGFDGIVLANSLQGAAYHDAQKRIKELAQSGILLAIASKNDENDVLHVLDEHPQMVLRRDDFVAIYANWEEKSNNIIKLAKTLNLGIDSFVFLDDNPVEQEKVRIALPEVTVVEFPNDISKLPNTIQEISNKYFHTFRLTNEDIKKTQLYQEETKRQIVLEKSSSIEEYLATLEVKIVLNKMKDIQLERTVQLINKTNQFNLTTARYSVEELIAYQQNKNNDVFVANVSDRFGDSGLVLILMVSREGNNAHIDNFLMSCRVMGRYIEDSVLTKIEDLLKGYGVDTIHAKYIPTAKNKPVESLMERLDYNLTKIDNDVKVYSRKLNDKYVNRKVLFAVELGNSQ